MIRLLLNRVGSQFSTVNIIKYFKNEGRTIGKETLYNYISYAKDVLLIYSAKRYDFIAIKNNSIEYYQVTYIMETLKAR